MLCCWDLKISNFVKLNRGYHPSKFQISWSSGSNFMKVSVRPQNVISYHCLSKLAYFVEHDIGYQPSKFQCFRKSQSNFMEGSGTPLSQCYDEIKKPSACSVKSNSSTVSLFIFNPSFQTVQHFKVFEEHNEMPQRDCQITPRKWPPIWLPS